MFRNSLVFVLVFAILAAAQAATIGSLTPDKRPAGSPATSITISGQNIAAGSKVSWTTPRGNVLVLTPDQIQDAQLAATIPAALLSTEGTAQVAIADPAGTLSNQLPFTISASIAIPQATLPDGAVGVPYSGATLAATGGAAPYTWKLGGGVLAGLSLDPSGAISGTPTAPGPYTFGVQATDAGGAKASGSFTINVNASALRITTPAVLPNGIAGFDYPEQILTATGGVTPYTYSYTGSLPAGLNVVNGEITGTPTAAGAANFQLTVKDASGATATRATQITIKPAGTVDLLLGAAAASFALTTGATVLPPAAVIPVQSSAVTQQPLTYTATVSPAAPWLAVSATAGTPGGITVALTSQALSLPASATPNQATIAVACTSTVCAGSTQNIVVSFTVSAQPPQLSVNSTVLTFTASGTAPPASVQLLSFQNSGGGSLGITSITAADTWLKVGSYPASLSGGASAAVTITTDLSKLQPGVYKSSIDIVTTGGRASIPVTLLVSSSANLILSYQGQQFNIPAGGALGNPNGSFQVAVNGSPLVTYTATVLPGATWLSLKSGAVSTATPTSPATVAYAIDPTIAALLATGTHYGTIRVTSEQVADSPQDFEVVLTVAAGNSKSFPDVSPAGLLYLSSGSQSVQVYANSAAPVPYQAAADASATANGIKWLSVSPATGTASATVPGNSSVTVNTVGLPAGVYRGGVSYSYSTAGVRTVNVTLIVPPTTAAARGGTLTSESVRPTPNAAGTCIGSQLVPSVLGPLSNFTAPASWPTPLIMRLYDDCATAVTNGQIIVTFPNGDPPLALSLVDANSGSYTGTWTPRGSGPQLNIGATATAPGYPSATTQVSGQVRPNPTPSIVPNGVTDIFNPVLGGALAPGSVVQIYGDGLAGQVGIPSSLPLPRSVGATSVIVGGIEAPLFYVSPGQINAQLPFELKAGNQYQLLINANGALTNPIQIQLGPSEPGILNAISGQIYAQRADGSFVSDAAPAKPGEYLVFYLLAMGSTDNPAVATGAGAPGLSAGDALANVADPPVLTVGGSTAQIVYAGLTPGTVGLYQVNFQVPYDARTGSQELVLTQGTTVANRTLLPVQGATN